MPVNATDASGYTALMRCCVSGHLLEALLSCDALDVNAGSAPDGCTALLLAARHRSARTVHTLLRRGAAFVRDVNGCSVLHKAAANSDPAVARLLLHAQADPCARDRDGRCPLAAALLQNNQGSALALLQWQQSRAARKAVWAAPPEAQRPSSASHARRPDGASSARPSAPTLDALPDDCLDHLLHFLCAPGAREAASGPASRVATPSCRRRGFGTVASAGEGMWASPELPWGASGVASPMASPMSSLIASPVANAANAAELSGAAALACTCARLRSLQRRRSVAAWLATDGLNRPVACHIPRGEYTTLLHLAAANGMDEVSELLLQRGADPLAVDSCGRTPCQVARGSAALIASLSHAQSKAANR